MTRDEVAKLMAIIRAAYPTWQRENEKPAFALWARELADADAALVLAALDEHIKTCKYAPTIAEIYRKRGVLDFARSRAPMFRPLDEPKMIGGGE